MPEFPSQTHLFYWREIKGLADAGVDCRLLSTRHPPQKLMTHSWAPEALRQTSFLGEMNIREVWQTLRYLVGRGPMALLRCFALIAGKGSSSIRDRLRLAILLLPAARLACLMEKDGIDHVHVQSCGDAANVAMLASRLCGIGYDLALLSPSLDDYGPDQENKWRHARFAVVMSDLLRGMVQTRLGHVAPSVVEVMPVGVDLDVMRRSDAYVPWDGEGDCLIYSCGRLNRVKGHTHLIEAARLLREEGFPIKLAIAGEDEVGGSGYHKDLQEQIDSAGLGDVVTLLGAVSETQHRQLLDSSHIFTLASLNEGISVAIMEAMAMQIPVVVTRVGGNAELVEDGENGVFVPPAEPVALADALRSVMVNPERARMLSARSRRKVEAKFSARAKAKDLADLFRRELKPKARP